MSKIIEALYDGEVLRLVEPLTLAPNTRVLITIETVSEVAAPTGSFLDTAMRLNLDGPADWSENIESYLYGALNRADA